MQRLEPYLGMTIAIALGVLIIAFSSTVTVVRTTATDTPTASSTLSVLPPPGTITILNPETSTTTQQTIVVPKKVMPPKSASEPVQIVVPVPVSIPTPSSPLVDNAALDAAAAMLRAALVNIICYAPIGSGVHPISGSGVFVSPKGVILTNAHIAQYLLLANRNVSCTIRAGSPATDSYEASLIYISPAWLIANANILIQASPNGTGEYDFAFLAVTSSLNEKALPVSFPFIPLATTPPLPGTPVVIASYGAQFLESNQIQFSLFPTVVFGSVKDVFTFAVRTIDVLALGGSVAAQKGSSGGGVASGSGELVGTITTSTVSGATDTRSLDAITASYIRAEYASETGEALDLLFAKPTATAVTDFASKISALEAIITANLP